MFETTPSRTKSRLWEPQSVIALVEANAGSSRRALLDRRLGVLAGIGVRTFCVSGDFDLGGPWAGVSEFFSELLPEIRKKRPDLLDRHSRELIDVFPQLSRTLMVRNVSLTDTALGDEKTRNYPADHAYRRVHGLIDLLDSWKLAECPDTRWIIGCDNFDQLGAIGALFFRELMRRRSTRLKLSLLAGVACGKAAATLESFDSTIPAMTMAIKTHLDPPSEADPFEAARMAGDLEATIGGDAIEKEVHLRELIRLWRLAGRQDKLLHYLCCGLDIYHQKGLYADAIRHSKGLLFMAGEQDPGNEPLQWLICLKLMMSYISLGDVDSASALAEDARQTLVGNHPDWNAHLYYIEAMLYARFSKPRDFAKGEEYLSRGLEAIEQIDQPEVQRQFDIVFNRNGLAMIRNFQGRHREAVELCRTGVETLNAHLGPDEHRLHRSMLLYNLAKVYAATRAWEDALNAYAAAMEMDPNYSEYYNERGNLFLGLGRLDEARVDYLKAIELSPPYFEVFANLGQCYRRMGEMDDAVQAYSRALDIEPSHVLARLGRAKAHEELGNTAPAIEDFTAAFALDATLWEAVGSRAALYYVNGDLDASLADFDRAIQLNPDVADLYQNRATVLTDLGRCREASEDLQSALALNPEEEDRIAIQGKLESLLQRA